MSVRNPQITVIFKHSERLLLSLRQSFPHALQNALGVLRFPAFPPLHPNCLPLSQTNFLKAQDGCQSHPHATPKFISGDTDASEPRPGCKRVLAMEIGQDSLFISGTLAYW